MSGRHHGTAPSPGMVAGARGVIVALFLLVVVGPLWVIFGILIWAASAVAGVAWFAAAAGCVAYAVTRAVRRRS